MDKLFDFKTIHNIIIDREDQLGYGPVKDDQNEVSKTFSRVLLGIGINPNDFLAGNVDKDCEKYRINPGEKETSVVTVKVDSYVVPERSIDFCVKLLWNTLNYVEEYKWLLKLTNSKREPRKLEKRLVPIHDKDKVDDLDKRIYEVQKEVYNGFYDYYLGLGFNEDAALFAMGKVWKSFPIQEEQPVAIEILPECLRVEGEPIVKHYY